MLVNVIKYKLDKMRRKIETEDMGTTNRASFVCTTCHKTFTDLEVVVVVVAFKGPEALVKMYFYNALRWTSCST